MSFHPFAIESLWQHGCRLVLDDDRYVDNEDELSVRSSPLVPIPVGSLLVGPASARLMRLHSLLMSSDLSSSVPGDQAEPLTPQDGLLLAAGLVENFRYQGVAAWFPPAVERSNQVADLFLLEQVGRNAPSMAEGLVYAGIARMMLRHGKDFVACAVDERIYLTRRVERPVGILDSKAAKPLIWETRLNAPAALVNAWTIPDATVRWLAAELEHEYPALLQPALESAPDFPAPRERVAG